MGRLAVTFPAQGGCISRKRETHGGSVTVRVSSVTLSRALRSWHFCRSGTRADIAAWLRQNESDPVPRCVMNAREQAEFDASPRHDRDRPSRIRCPADSDEIGMQVAN
jgi:hypothetical protein